MPHEPSRHTRGVVVGVFLLLEQRMEGAEKSPKASPSRSVVGEEWWDEQDITAELAGCVRTGSAYSVRAQLGFKDFFSMRRRNDEPRCQGHGSTQTGGSAKV
jgi:hypothetical protein